MDYRESIAYLKGLTTFGINLGLGRIQDLLARLDHPERQVKFVHVGGTNGKGSTAAMLAAILTTAGLKTGLFTSPHLHAYTERVRINGEEISEPDIAELLTILRGHLDDIVAAGHEHPTEFEVSTALAILHFARQKVEMAVMEVGMGGEIDSTNVILPELSIITNVGMDHMDYLGPTIADIARVKAGIIKAGVPVLTAADHPDALMAIRRAAAEKGSAIGEYGRDFAAEPLSYDDFGQTFNCRVGETVFRDLRITLRGRHQLINASLAIAGAVQLGIGEAAIRQGLAAAQWACRLETVSRSPLVVIDAAHNHHGVLVLVDALKQYWPQQKKVLVLGMLADKEREKVVAELAPLVDKVVVTKPNNPRAGDWREIADFVRPWVQEVRVEEDIAKAVEMGLALAGDDHMLLITGSIYMVAEARAFLLKK